ncbi:MAG: hypothetical protein J5762_04405 [Clostridia bacterium]|nr:hypothetical protein [Clostridia bacterium]
MKRGNIKFIGIILTVVVLVVSLFTFVGCNDMPVSPVGEETIEISYSLGGFGDAWINEAIEKFNAAFKDKGYSAVMTRCDAAFDQDAVTNEIKSYEDNSYDLYITIGNNMNLVDSSYSVLRKKGQCLLEDLTDVYNAKVINLDGSEGTETVMETRNGEMLPFCSYNFDNPDFKGKYYGFQWTSAYGGIVVNTKVLRDFGYDHTPRTTKEMKEMCDNVLNQSKKTSKGKRIYPMTWPGANASGYFEYSLLTWMAQYMGVEGYMDFFRFKPEDGDILGHGYDVYDNEGILYALRAMESIAGQEYAATGTVTTTDHLLSDQTLAEGEALFEIAGDWCYSELVGLEYDYDTLANIEIMPVPIVSELADKIELQGSAEQKESVLRNIVKGIDDGKTDNQIASENSVTEKQVADVREARGIYYDLGRGHQAYIPSYSDAKDVAKLFLRFISSKEFSDNVYSKKAFGITANKSTAPNDNNFLSSLTSCCRKPYSTPISEITCISEIRYNGGIVSTFEPYYYGDLAKSMAMRLSEYTADKVYDKVKNGMKNNWSVILVGAGL